MDSRLNANKTLIEKARMKAQKLNSSLNKLFRNWLEGFVNSEKSEEKFEEIMAKLDYVKFDRKFSREEMNER
ncbi:MAG: antitoxin [Bacteroidota bacterium]